MSGGGKIAENDESVADLGEWGVIAALKARMPAGALTSVGIGDDSAVVGTPSGSVVAAVDLLIEGRHFRREWASARDVGVKAAARSLADIAAMGAVNTALLVALAAPGTLPARWATDLAEGLAAEAARAGAGIVGGDTARAEVITLSVTALGDLEGRRPVLRSGARPGDVIAVAGPLGRSAAGLALLASGAVDPPPGPGTGHPLGAGHPLGTGLPPGAARLPGAGLPPGAARLPGAGLLPGVGRPHDPLAGLVAAHLRPAPPYDAGPEAARLGATAMIDVSDGLLADLGHIAEASGVHIDLNSSALAPPADLREAAARLAKPESSRTTDGSSPPSTPPQTPPTTVPSRAPGATVSGGAPGTSVPREAPEASVFPDAQAGRSGANDGGYAAALSWVLTGGEDHSLVAAFPPGVALPARWRLIGQVRGGAGVTVDGAPHVGSAGWQHFT